MADAQGHLRVPSADQGIGAQRRRQLAWLRASSGAGGGPGASGSGRRRPISRRNVPRPISAAPGRRTVTQRRGHIRLPFFLYAVHFVAGDDDVPPRSESPHHQQPGPAGGLQDALHLPHRRHRLSGGSAEHKIAGTN